MYGIFFKENSAYMYGFPSRIGIRRSTIDINLKEEYKKKFLQLKQNEYDSGKEKINVNISELNKIFNNSVNTLTELKIAICPIYCPNESKFRVEKMSKEDVIRLLMENSLSGTYKPIEYVNLFYKTKKSGFDFQKVYNNIEFFRVFQNEKNIKQLDTWLNKKINEV